MVVKVVVILGEIKAQNSDNDRERIATVPKAIGISLFATRRFHKRYPGLPVGLGLTEH